MAKKNMSLTKVPMPEQAPDVRNKNFEEVALGYTAEMAMEEAARCLNCKNKPCVSGCPVNVPIPGFIEKVAEGDFEAMRLSQVRTHFLQSADVYVHRRTSVRVNVSVVSRDSLLVSDVWKDSLQITIWNMLSQSKQTLRRMARRLQS